MVKKTYEAPSMNEARTKLRTGLLAGSVGFGNNTTADPVKGSGQGVGNAEGGTVGSEARKRSVSSVD